MKLDKRKLLGPLFIPLFKAKHSETLRIVTATFWLPSQLILARRNRPYFAVNIVSRNGLGAVLAEALLICHYAVSNGLLPRVTSTNPLYAAEPGKDFINSYLGRDQGEAARKLRPTRYHTPWDFYHLKFDKHMSLKRASEIFWNCFPPKPVITEKVEAILAGTPRGEFDLSIHYRGTDKAYEAPLVNFENFERAILDHQTEVGGIKHVFLATDDHGFESFVRGRFPGVEFFTFNLGSALDTSRGRHFSDMKPEDKATEALVNMFLLAAAPKCIRGASYMSAMSKIINPELKTQTLNRTHWGSTDFPEHEILLEEVGRSMSRS